MEYLTVSALNKYIRYKINNDTNLKQVYIKGEISNLKIHQKGNVFFTLKDEYSNIQALILDKRNYNDILKDGIKVLIKGSVDLYVPNGSYKIIVEEISLDGIGELYLKYEALKAKLKNEGLFDLPKKQIPRFPKRIGVITSKTGAVIEDIKETVKLRYPLAKIILYPTNVQGADAKLEIVKRLNEADNDNLDCLIIGRGGGSIEDLWSFNEEIVVRTISKIKIPVISAIGHETDTTLSDYVSDLRASTPTGAAMSATIDKRDILDNILNLEKRLNKAILNNINNKYKMVENLTKIVLTNKPTEKLSNYYRRLEMINNNLIINIKNNLNVKLLKLEGINKRLNSINLLEKISDYNLKIDELNNRLNRNIEVVLTNKTNRFNSNVSKLQAINPLSLLEKGYSVVYKDNNLVKSINDVSKNDVIEITLNDGKIKAEVI